MGISRRRVRLEQSERWIYNRMAEAYAFRPAYPPALIAALSVLAEDAGDTVDAARQAHPHILDIGAGIGHLALPLAALGHRVTAVEPAIAMLDALRAREPLSQVQARHASAEALPLEGASVDLALIADAIHFLDAHRAGRELARVLRPRGALAVVHVELGSAPFTRALEQLMQASAPRRPRRVDAAMTQLAALAGIQLELRQTLESTLPMKLTEIEQILRSISFIGPAMSPERFAAFRTRLHQIEHPPVWSTTLRLWAGRRAENR